MRPFTLAFRVSLAAASAAISRALAPPRTPASLQIHQKTWQRLSGTSTNNSMSTSASSWAAARQHCRPPFAMDANLSREAARHRGELLRGQGAGRARFRALMLGSRGRPGRSDGHDNGFDNTAATATTAAAAGVPTFDDDLNESQRRAVCAEVGPVRVVAGPGSGKTRVLTRRIAHLVQNIGAPAWSILAVTFTRKASEEMRVRVRDALGEQASSQVALGTFHSVCARLLRRHGNALPAVVPGLDGGFSIFDTEDSRRLLAEIMRDMGIDVLEEKVKPAEIRSAISKLKSKGLQPEDVLVDRKPGRTGPAKYQQMVLQIYEVYKQRLIQSNALDFDDIILVTLMLLQKDKEVFQAVGRQYRHVLVDEWQDTNGPQYDLVMGLARAGLEAQFAREDARRAADVDIELARSGDILAEEGPDEEGGANIEGEGTKKRGASKGKGGAKRKGTRRSAGVQMPPPSIFVVGDSDQCIYRFRGADYTNVNRFVNDFEGCETILLRENYRSTANIARAATAVIKKVEERIEQPTIAIQGDGLPLGVMRCSDAAGEALAVATQLELYWSSGRVPASEMAVMYRTNAQSRSFEEACLKKALPFVIIGAQRFYERREVKDCLMYLRLAANPRDALAMRRAINTPPRGIGAKTELALHVLLRSARALPGLQNVTGPECLMALLDQDDLDDLESAIATESADALGAGGGMAIASPVESTLEGGSDAGASFGEGGGSSGIEVSAAVQGGGGGGWGGFSVHRAWLVGQAIEKGEVEGPTKAQASKLRAFASILCALKTVAATESVPELLSAVLADTDMHNYVTEKLGATAMEGADRWQNILELERAASNPRFAGVADAGALESFLNEVALMGGDNVEDERKRREEEEAAAAAGVVPVPGAARPPMIQLMTVHASKGLEFDTVFLTGLEEGTFPSELAAKEGVDEERRLMYVGMTRAKARLFMSWREERLVFTPAGARRLPCLPSSFLADIPKDIVRTIDKTSPGHVSRRQGGGKKHGDQNGSSQYRGGGSGVAVRSRGAGRGRGAKGRDGSAADRGHPKAPDALDVTTELFSDIAPDSGRRGSGEQQAYGGGGRGGGRGRGRAGRGGYGSGGGGGGGGRDGRSLESREGRVDARVFQQVRNQAKTSKYPVPVVRDGGAGMAREAGEEIDMSWTKKLVSSPAKAAAAGLPKEIDVGAQVSHPIHGPGQVVALVEGSEGVNVRFVSKGNPFVTRVLGSKLKKLS